MLDYIEDNLNIERGVAEKEFKQWNKKRHKEQII